jgi:transcriptional regulator of aromatic amino acid metabolism
MDKSINSGSDPDKNQNTQHRSLAELEGIVRTGLATYQEVGSALDEIHEHKLYRELKYKNFKTYLQERWGISRAHAYRLINAAKVAEMSPIGDKPENEYQARTKPVIEKRSKAKPASKVVFNLDAEFESFKATVERWEKALSTDDFAKLMERVAEFVGKSVAEKEVVAQ